MPAAENRFGTQMLDFKRFEGVYGPTSNISAKLVMRLRSALGILTEGFVWPWTNKQMQSSLQNNVCRIIR